MVTFDRVSFGDKDIDHIYDWTDQHFLNGDFAVVDLWISYIDVTHPMMSVDKMLAILSATLSAKSKLLKRPYLYLAVEEELKKRNEKVEELLAGLQ